MGVNWFTANSFFGWLQPMPHKEMMWLASQPLMTGYLFMGSVAQTWAQLHEQTFYRPRQDLNSDLVRRNQGLPTTPTEALSIFSVLNDVTNTKGQGFIEYTTASLSTNNIHTELTVKLHFIHTFIY